jgi:hypothetical protein
MHAPQARCNQVALFYAEAAAATHMHHLSQCLWVMESEAAVCAAVATKVAAALFLCCFHETRECSRTAPAPKALHSLDIACICRYPAGSVCCSDAHASQTLIARDESKKHSNSFQYERAH